jgi:hypothetical protein
MSTATSLIMGAFLVFPLDPGSFKNFSETARMDKVPQGMQTAMHTHPFLSAYVTNNLNLYDGINHYTLPGQALVMVPVDALHSWIPQENAGQVGSVGHAHEVQALIVV